MGFFYAAYALVWVGVLLYTFRLQSQQKKLEREQATMEEIIAELRSKS